MNNDNDEIGDLRPDGTRIESEIYNPRKTTTINLETIEDIEQNAIQIPGVPDHAPAFGGIVILVGDKAQVK